MQRRIIQLVNDAPMLPLVAFGSSFKQVNKTNLNEKPAEAHDRMDPLDREPSLSTSPTSP